MLNVKRAYEESAENDGIRILVDRLWPRGLRKDRAKIDLWLKEAAPSDALRQWFGHDRTKWDEFKRRYFEELEKKEAAVDSIVSKTSRGPATLLYGSKDEDCNNAVALREFIEQRIQFIKRKRSMP